MEVLSTSELLFRVGSLVGLCRSFGWSGLLVDNTVGTAGDVVFPDESDWYSPHGSAMSEEPRRQIPGISANDESVRALATQNKIITGFVSWGWPSHHSKFHRTLDR